MYICHDEKEEYPTTDGIDLAKMGDRRPVDTGASILEAYLDLIAAVIFGRTFFFFAKWESWLKCDGIDAGASSYVRRRLLESVHCGIDLVAAFDFVPSYAVVDILFYPGITTRRVVERDSPSRSDYATSTGPLLQRSKINFECRTTATQNRATGCVIPRSTCTSSPLRTPHPPYPHPSASPDRHATHMNRLSLEHPFHTPCINTVKTLLLWLS